MTTLPAQPLVSVIMPTYNRASLIGAAIESVLAQTYPHFELIVIDNFSDDDTERVVLAYAARDARVKYFKFANHGLVAASRNAGMRAAGGKYLAFLDSDDAWLPAKLARQVAFLESHPLVFLLYSRFHISKDGIITGVGPRRFALARGRAFKQLFLSDNVIGSLTVMMRREGLGAPYLFRAEPALYAVEDYDLWLRVARDHAIDYLDEPLAIHHRHDTNMTSSVRQFFVKNVRLMEAYRGEVPRSLIARRYVQCFLPVLASLAYRPIAKIFRAG